MHPIVEAGRFVAAHPAQDGRAVELCKTTEKHQIKRQSNVERLKESTGHFLRGTMQLLREPEKVAPRGALRIPIM